MRRRKRLLQDLDQDIRDHLDRETHDNIERGMDPEEARYAALRKFGNVARVKEETREAWGLLWLHDLRQDLRYAGRMLRKSPGFAVVAVLTLALGIGANTAIFSILNSVLLKNLPVKDPQQLVFLTNADNQGGEIGFEEGDRDFLTYPEYQNLASNNHVFSGLFAFSSFNTEVPVGIESGNQSTEPAPAQVSLVSGSYFSVLGVDPILGRSFTSDVDRVRDASPLAVISYGFWQARFAGDRAVVGRKLRILSTSYDVIGVAPPQFHGETVGDDTDIWVPLTMQSEIFPGRDYLTPEAVPFHKTEWLQAIGRLKPGITLTQAAVEINLSFQQILRSQAAGMTAADSRSFLNQRLDVTEGGHGASTLRANFGKPLQILMAVVALILLIACANVASILLARSAARQREISVRVALGARASRLFRQMLTESLLLAAIGGVLGLLLARLADAALLRMVSSSQNSVSLDVHSDPRVLAFNLGISVLTGILFGLAPAFQSYRVDLNRVLKGTSRGVAGGSKRGGPVSAGKILVIAQVALSVLLLAVAGLFVQSFRNLAQVELGFNRDRLLAFVLNPLSFGYQRPQIPPLYKDLLERLGAIPGISGVTLSQNAPFSGTDNGSLVSIDGETPKFKDIEARWDCVGPSFFSTVGIPILMGREIGPQDSLPARRVGVINQAMARKYFGNANPIGRSMIVQTTSERLDFVVVGISGNSKHGNVREEVQPRFYVPFLNPIGDGWANHASILLRTAGNPSGVVTAIRAAVKQTAGTLPPLEIEAINQVVADSLTSDRMVTQLSEAFGALALCLVCIGLYGIMAYSVSARTNEMGIRIALGARRSNVLWLVLRESSLLILIGVAIGLPVVFLVRNWIASLLFGVKPADPVTLATATAFMFVVGIFACYIPARRAMRVDPVIALRYE